jgi:hypothetical protein
MYYTSDIKTSPFLAEISQLSNLCLCSKMSHKTSFCSLSTMFLFSSHTLSHLCCLYCHILRTKSSNEIYDLIYNIHTCSVLSVPRIQIISLVVFTECRIISTITSRVLPTLCHVFINDGIIPASAKINTLSAISTRLSTSNYVVSPRISPSLIIHMRINNNNNNNIASPCILYDLFSRLPRVLSTSELCSIYIDHTWSA